MWWWRLSDGVIRQGGKEAGRDDVGEEREKDCCYVVVDAIDVDVDVVVVAYVMAGRCMAEAAEAQVGRCAGRGPGTLGGHLGPAVTGSYHGYLLQCQLTQLGIKGLLIPRGLLVTSQGLILTRGLRSTVLVTWKLECDHVNINAEISTEFILGILFTIIKAISHIVRLPVPPARSWS